MALPPSQKKQPLATSVHKPLASSSVVACSTFAVAMWLVLGLIARGSEEFQASDDANMLVSFAFVTQVLACFVAIGIVCSRSLGRGAQIFAAAMAGFGISTCTVVSRDVKGTAVVFYALSGIYVGWLVELIARPCASLTEYLNRAVPP